MSGRRPQSGQVMVLVALSLIALIGSAALVLLAGSAEWQKNQLQQIADQAALDAALKIGIGCDSGKANAVILAADNSIAAQRARSGTLGVAAGTCATPYVGTDTFVGGLSATINYPYRAHQQQVEVILTLALPLSFGGVVGKTSTSIIRRAVAQQLAGSVPAVSANTLTCSGGQVNVAGSIAVQNQVVRSGTCALYAHARFDAASGTYSDLGNVSVYTDGQTWTAPGTCIAGSNSGSSNAICSDGFELSGNTAPGCATATTSYLSAGDKAVNPNPCAAGTGPQAVAPRTTTLPPEPNADPAIYTRLPGGVPCNPAANYGPIQVGGVTVATGLEAAPLQDPNGYYHFTPGCYGYLNPSLLTGKKAVLDAGFYYFNGSGFAGGGGICLDSSTLLARDVTLEFVNAAGFSSGSCSQGGGSGSTFWLQGTNDCPVGACHLQTTDPNSGQQSVKFTPSPDDFVFSETVSAPGAQTVPAGTVYSFTYHSTGGRTINATITFYYSAVTPCGLPSGATNLISWAVPLPDPGATVTSPASPAPVTIPSGAFLCLDVAGSTSSGNENFLFNDTNHAGMISTTAAILPSGAGAGCSGTCQFGSIPCSISVCPPNTGADSPNNLTWFASPCSAAPSAADAASCPVSAWCPAGDRSCQNLLIWAPAGSTGQFAITGAAATAWLLGSISWPSACTFMDNGTSLIAGAVSCTDLSLSAAAGAGLSIGSDAGISTALVEAILVE